jgi:hypothetical protein
MMLSACAESIILSVPPAESMMMSGNMVQLVGGLLLEPFGQGFKPSGVGLIKNPLLGVETPYV